MIPEPETIDDAKPSAPSPDGNLQKYQVSIEQERSLLARFNTYEPNGVEQYRRLRVLRNKARDLARAYLELTPPSREQLVAIKRLEESFLYAQQAALRHEGPQPRRE